MPKPLRPSTPRTRGKLGGLGTMARHGTEHFRELAGKSQSKLDARLAREAGIPDDLPPAEYDARMAAARSAYFLRLAEARWGKVRL